MAIRNEPRRSGQTIRSVAVEIGFAAVRAVEVEIRGEGARLVKRGTAPVPPGCWDDLAAAREGLAQAIRAALSTGGIAATQVVAALPRRLVTLKYARLPQAEPEQIRGMVQFEAQQYIPFPIEEVVLDHQIVSDETDDMTTVMIVAARRTLVEDLLAVFDRAGLEVTRLSVSALALAEHAQHDTIPLALVDVEPGEMEMAVVADGRPLFTRAAALDETIGTQAGGHILAGEVARSLAAYQNEHRAEPVGRLLVAGPPGELDGVEQALGGLLEVPVGRMNGRLLPGADPDALGYAIAIGLALEADGRGLSRINLIPLSRAERKIAARRRVNTAAATIALIAVIAVAGYYLTRSLADRRQENTLALRENNRLGRFEKALKVAKTEHDQLAKTYQTVAAGLSRPTPAVEIVKAVSDALPKDGSLYLTQLAFERNGNLTVHGTARNEAAATDMVLSLQGSGVFTEARLSYLGDAQAETLPTAAGPNAALSRSRPGEKMSFIIACRLKGNEGAKGRGSNGSEGERRTVSDASERSVRPVQSQPSARAVEGAGGERESDSSTLNPEPSTLSEGDGRP